MNLAEIVSNLVDFSIDAHFRQYPRLGCSLLYREAA